MKISEILIMMTIGVGASLALLNFMADLSGTYSNIEVPEALQNESDRFLIQINDTTNDMMTTMTGEGNWLQNAYIIFFRMPVQMINLMGSSISLEMSFMSELAATDTGIAIPPWIIVIVGVVLAIMTVFSLLMFVGVRE